MWDFDLLLPWNYHFWNCIESTGKIYDVTGKEYTYGEDERRQTGSIGRGRRLNTSSGSPRSRLRRMRAQATWSRAKQRRRWAGDSLERRRWSSTSASACWRRLCVSGTFLLDVRCTGSGILRRIINGDRLRCGVRCVICDSGSIVLLFIVIIVDENNIRIASFVFTILASNVLVPFL